MLALALFVAASTVITSALSASVDETERLRLKAHAGDLAATILAEMQMGLQPVETSGPNNFEAPFVDWTWQASAEPVTDPTGGTGVLQNVEIVIRNQRQPVVCRLSQFLPGSGSGGFGPGKAAGNGPPGPIAAPASTGRGF